MNSKTWQEQKGSLGVLESWSPAKSTPALQHSSTPGPRRSRVAFTIIELLAVIAIIGLLAGMVLFLGPAINDLRKRKLVHAQMEQLAMLIEHYKEVKGFYPPDNPKNPATNSLYYELTAQTTDRILLKKFFGVNGIINSPDGGGATNIFFRSIKDNQIININPAAPLYILGVKVTPPRGSALTDFCPWHYRVAPQTPDPSIHNPNGFDLWVEAEMSKGPMTFGNWKDKE